MTRSQRLLAGFFALAGTMHFVRPRAYRAIMPPYVPRHREAVIVSGAAVIPRSTRTAARWWLTALLLAVFPANVHMALHPELYRVPRGRLALYLRLPVQALFIAWAIAARRD